MYQIGMRVVYRHSGVTGTIMKIRPDWGEFMIRWDNASHITPYWFSASDDIDVIDPDLFYCKN